jgi:hypothetical protein
VFFYWVRVTVPAGGNTVTITQSITTGNFTTWYAQASGSNVFDPSCTKVRTQRVATSDATTSVTFTAPIVGTYYIGIKYSASSLTGASAPTVGSSGDFSVHTEFSATGTGTPPNNTRAIDLRRK